MVSTHLVFQQPRHTGGNPVPLVFGAGGQAEVPSYAITARGRITVGLRGQVRMASVLQLQAKGRITGLRGSVAVRWNVNVSRPTVNDITALFQPATPTNDAVRTSWQESDTLLEETRNMFQGATPLSANSRATWADADKVLNEIEVRHQEAALLPVTPIRVRYQEGVSLRNALSQWFQEAERLGTAVLRNQYQDAYRDRRNFTAARFEKGAPYSVAWMEHGGAAKPLSHSWVAPYQQAIKPPMGIWVRPGPQPADPCYVPELPAHLVFIDPWTGSPNIVFVCDRHNPEPPEPPEPGDTVVVPVRSVYLTINSAVLVRVDNGHFIPTTAMSMNLDVDSWTWSFSASIPGAALSDVEPNSNGDPVIVQVTINGVPYRLAVEKIGRDRTFNASQLRVSGRGIGAELDAPYAPVMQFGNDQPRNARQLLDDILLFNGVPIGWEIDEFQPTDWAVPAGVFNHSGTYISALNTVAAAAGAYVQPHNTDKKLRVLSRYPRPAWEWADETPQFVLPASVTSQEGFEWADKPKYNRVYVSGQEHGVLGQYTRRGTAGDLTAPMVVDPLITHADAAMQRGRSILSDTGRINTVTLRLPVLAETGIIKPGNFVHYTEGGNTHVGLTRAVGVSVAMPTIYQTLTVETHVEPV